MPSEKIYSPKIVDMKKIVLPIAILACALLLTSCSENLLQDMFELISGNATATINGSETESFSSSIAMFENKKAEPVLTSLSMNIEIDDLMNLTSENDITFPFLAYRLVGNDLTSNATLKIENTLTEEDMVDFDYTNLINGKFADSQIVGMALSKTQFYVMKSGELKLDKVSGKKITGSYSGTAYFIDLEANPILSEEEVPFKGTFTSRVIPLMKWLQELQEEEQ